MKNYHLNPLQNSEVPSKILNLITDDLKNYIIIKDGHIIKQDLSAEFSKVYVGSYEQALPEKINVFLETEFCNACDEEAYNYNIENVNSGMLIHVPKNTVVTDVLHVFYIQETNDLVNNVRIVLEDNSELKYFEYLYNNSKANISFVSNAIIKENARLNYSGLSRFNELASASIIRNAYVFRYGNVSYSIAEVNDSLTDSKTFIHLQEKYASGTSKTVAITNKDQVASFKQLIEHNAPETEGYIENYGVSNDTSYLEFEGTGKINKDMKRSIARQSNKGIVLGEKARLDANPLLLIDEYDVVAQHGAAIGKIDDEQLYYLMSRGLSLKVAERLIISGFLSPVLRILSTDTLKNDFINCVELKTQ